MKVDFFADTTVCTSHVAVLVERNSEGFVNCRTQMVRCIEVIFFLAAFYLDRNVSANLWFFSSACGFLLLLGPQRRCSRYSAVHDHRVRVKWQLKNLSFFGTVRIIFQLGDEIPCISALVVALLPKVYFSPAC